MAIETKLYNKYAHEFIPYVSDVYYYTIRDRRMYLKYVTESVVNDRCYECTGQYDHPIHATICLLTGMGYTHAPVKSKPILVAERVEVEEGLKSDEISEFRLLPKDYYNKKSFMLSVYLDQYFFDVMIALTIILFFIAISIS